MIGGQLNLPLNGLDVDLHPALMSPREIWAHLSPLLVAELGEDRRIERKSVQSINFNDIAEYYSCFSNTPEGGVLVFGVEDDGSLTGCAQLDQAQLNRIEVFHRQLCPLAKPEIKRIPLDDAGNFLIAIYLPYVGLLVETNRQDAFIRYGDSKARMSEAEKSDFRATRHELSFELQHSNLNFPDDFDMNIVDEFCQQFCEREGREGWSTEEILEDRFLGRRTDQGFEPNNALVLLAARQPGLVIPGSRVRVQRWAETTEGVGSEYSPLRDRFVEGNIVSIIQNARSVIEDLNYDVTWLNKEGKFETTSEYPYWAWFEALVNACVHRSYSFSGTETTVKFFSDRLEIESPGGFVPPVNEQSIYDVRAARNPHLMDALRYLGYVRMAREGARRIRASMEEAELPEPIFQQESVHGVAVRVTLRNDFETRKRTTNRDVAQFFGVELWKQLQEHEIGILAYAFRNETLNVTEAQKVTGRTWATSKKDLERLTWRGLLEYIPGEYTRDPKAHYRLVRIPPET